MIPLIDLKKQYLSIKNEIDEAMASVIDDVSFIAGTYAQKFEEEFASYIGVKHCVACANGTDALEMALEALGLGEGDEVIVPAISWISTAECVSKVGASVVFADVDYETNNISLKHLEATISSKTKAVIPVHLFGNPVDMPKLMQIADRHNLYVVEDCAQAHGATVDGRKAGSFGHMATFSFYPGKNLGAYGDAGGIVTNDEKLAEKARLIGNHGQAKKFEFQFEGRNSRMDGLQAAILSVKLKHLDNWTSLRIQHVEYYNALLKDVVDVPSYKHNMKHVFHQYVIKGLKDRDELKQFLLSEGIQTAIHYPEILPYIVPYKETHGEFSFPNAEKVVTGILSLPMFPEMTNGQIEKVTDKIKGFLSA